MAVTIPIQAAGADDAAASGPGFQEGTAGGGAIERTGIALTGFGMQVEVVVQAACPGTRIVVSVSVAVTRATRGVAAIDSADGNALIFTYDQAGAPKHTTPPGQYARYALIGNAVSVEVIRTPPGDVATVGDAVGVAIVLAFVRASTEKSLETTPTGRPWILPKPAILPSAGVRSRTSGRAAVANRPTSIKLSVSSK